MIHQSTWPDKIIVIVLLGLYLGSLSSQIQGGRNCRDVLKHPALNKLPCNTRGWFPSLGDFYPVSIAPSLARSRATELWLEKKQVGDGMQHNPVERGLGK